jgi:hypothetical protein
MVGIPISIEKYVIIMLVPCHPYPIWYLVKVKGKPVPLLTYHAMKMYGTVEAELHAFLPSAVDRGDGQLHTSSTLPPGK